MFEPGQKVMVVKSNFNKKTGPKVGSIGFVSDFNVNVYGLRFNKVVWYQFGNQETCRMETGSFGMLLPSPTANFSVNLRDLGCRRGGILVPIFEKKKIEDMESLEFNCWLYSIMRLYRGHRPAEKARAKMSFYPVDFSPTRFSRHEFNVKRRVELANIARELKLIAFKTYKRDIEHYLTQAIARLDRLNSDGLSVENIIDHMIVKRGARYEYFYELFTRMTYFNVVGNIFINNINTDSNPYHVILRPMWREWQKLHVTSS